MADMLTGPWPSDLLPQGAPVVTRNTLDAEVTPDAVWRALIEAPVWPTFYDNARDVRLPDGAEALGPDMPFTWRTLGLPVATLVTDFEAPSFLAWRGDTWYGRGRHTWLIEPRDGGCRIVTEEVQRGLVPTLAGWWIRPKLLFWHQRWLEGLVRAASGSTDQSRPAAR